MQYDSIGTLKKGVSTRLVLGSFIPCVLTMVWLAAFGESLRSASTLMEKDRKAAIAVGVIFLSATIWSVYEIARYALLVRRLLLSKRLDGENLIEGSVIVPLSYASVSPVYRRRSSGLWPLSEGVWFEAQGQKILLAPGLLTAVDADRFHRAWERSGKGLLDYLPDNLQEDPVPRC